VNVEQAAAPEPRTRSSAVKPKTVAAATHKRTPRKAKAEPSTAVAVPHVETVVDVPLAAPASPIIRRIPSPEEIAIRAYLRWEARGYQGGSPEEDWLCAERELTELAQNR
jgi:hypothetical protein